MSYYKLLGLKTEPFSTSPDPQFFYQSNAHKSAFYKIRINIDLKRGLSLILGDMGMGKTTLIRTLYNQLSCEDGYFTKIILDPQTSTESDFIILLANALQIDCSSCRQIYEYKQAIEHFLFNQAIGKNKTVVLFIDEAQKLSQKAMEVLRSLLNYETNEYKILQLILMGQMELLPKISRMMNLWDRISLKYKLLPLNFEETKEMVFYRLKQAGFNQKFSLFEEDAIEAVFEFSKGYPRKIAMCCHQALEYLVMYQKIKVTREIIEELQMGELKPVESLR